MRERGFTLIEMVISMIIIAIVCAVALPNLDNFFSPSADAARETVLGALRQAKNQAFTHRRLVCLTASGSSITAVQASANPAVSCGSTAVLGPDGKPNFLSDISGVTVSASPASILYFQPDGTLTSNLAGSTQSNYVLTITVGSQSPTVVGVSGASATPQ
jgi:MSHA pilin protein MshC